MLELIVIPNENELKLENQILKYKIENNNKEGHLGACKRFVREYNINISDLDSLTSYQLSLELSKLDNVSIHVENMIMIIYLPQILSDEQAKWFKNNRRLLSKFSLAILSIQEDESIKHIEEDEDESKSVLNRLYREIKKKELFKKKHTLENSKTNTIKR